MRPLPSPPGPGEGSRLGLPPRPACALPTTPPAPENQNFLESYWAPHVFPDPPPDTHTHTLRAAHQWLSAQRL